jgi:hypothetical protein
MIAALLRSMKDDSDNIVNQLLKLALYISPDVSTQPRMIKVIRFDGTTEIDETEITGAELAKAFHESRVIGAQDGKFKVII